MRTQITVKKLSAALAFASMLVLVTNADPSWKGQLGSGPIDDASMWSATPAPIYNTQTAAGGRNFAQVWPGSSWASTIYITNDIAIFNGGFSINMQPAYNNTLDFDGAGVTLVHGDVPDGMGDRNVADVFFCENGSGGNYRWFNSNVGNKRHAAYLWSNAWFRVDHQHRTPGSTDSLDVVNSITFGRGYVLWGGTNETDVAGTVTFGGGGSSGYRNSMVVTNSTVVVSALDWQTKTPESSLLLSGSGAKLVVLKHAYVGKNASTTQPGTNVFTIADGATLCANRSATATDDFYLGPSSASPQVCRMTVTGAGALLDYHTSNRGMGVNNGGILEISNGGTLHVRSSIATRLVAGNKGAVIRLTGEGSSILFRSADDAGDGTMAVDGGEDSVFEQSGGEVKTLSPTGKLSIYLGQEFGRNGVYRLSGGTFDMASAAGTRGPIRVGMKGSGTMEVTGGTVLGCDSITLAERAQDASATGVTTNIYRQTGGTVEAISGGLICNQAADPNRRSSIELLGGVFVGKRLSGGGGVSPTSQLYPKCYGNGGVFRAVPDGCYHKTYPFVYGFSAIELGPKGLTLDLRSKNNVTQRFTNRAGETGRLIITGPSTASVYFDAPDGGDNAELVLGTPKAVFESVMTNWQTRVVVTNDAHMSLEESTGLALKELVIGNDTSVGQLTVAPKSRLSLSSAELNNLQINLSGTFARDTGYPVVSVKGEVSAASAMAWKSARVTGTKPSGCVARMSASYSSADDMTTLSITFTEVQSPSVANEWAGAAGGEDVAWENPDCWSAGVPDAASCVTLSSESSGVAATLSLDTCASLGALAFTSLRDYAIVGDGHLFFEDCGVAAAISVAGGNQRIDVPVVAVEDIAVDVATGARLTFGEKVMSSAGALVVNGELAAGRVVLEGVGSAFKNGIIHRCGILQATLAEVFGPAFVGGAYEFKGYTMLRCDGDPAAPAYRLPFGFKLHGGSADGTSWGSPKIVENDRSLVVPSCVTNMAQGGTFVKRGRGDLVFETKDGVVLTMTTANGNNAWNNARLPGSAFKFDVGTGRPDTSGGYGGVNVHEGRLVFRGADAVEPTSASQAVRHGFGTVVGYRTTNTVSVTPGLVIDRAYADLGATKTSASANSDISYISLAQDAWDTDYPRAATNAFIVVTNGSTLATGRLRVGATTFVTEGFMDISPRIVVDSSTCRVVDGLDFAAQKKVHADWQVRNGSTLLTGTNSVVWAGEANVSIDGGSALAGGDGTEAATIALGADARGALTVSGGSTARLGTVTAAEGASVSFAFDGGALVGIANGGTIGFPSAVTLEAKAGGLLIDVPAGETWTLAKDVTGPGFVTLNGEGTLALSGTVSAGFAGGGTVSGGTIASGRILADAAGARGTPTFAGVAVSGIVKVDLGLGDEPQSAPYPTGVRVATFSGTVPPASAFRLVNAGVGESGRKLRGAFAVSDGVVTVDVVDKGFVLIVR